MSTPSSQPRFIPLSQYDDTTHLEAKQLPIPSPSPSPAAAAAVAAMAAAGSASASASTSPSSSSPFNLHNHDNTQHHPSPVDEEDGVGVVIPIESTPSWPQRVWLSLRQSFHNNNNNNNNNNDDDDDDNSNARPTRYGCAQCWEHTRDYATHCYHIMQPFMKELRVVYLLVICAILLVVISNNRTVGWVSFGMLMGIAFLVTLRIVLTAYRHHQLQQRERRMRSMVMQNWMLDHDEHLDDAALEVTPFSLPPSSSSPSSPASSFPSFSRGGVLRFPLRYHGLNRMNPTHMRLSLMDRDFNANGLSLIGGDWSLLMLGDGDGW